jgi:hypothetical protein
MSRMPFAPGAYLAAAVVFGLIGGWLFHGIWRRVLPQTRSREFWTTVPASMRGMLTSEATRDLLRHYRTLIVGGFRYAGRNVLAVLVAMTPIAAIAVLLNALDPSGRLAASIEVSPATAIAPPAQSLSRWHTDGERLLISRAALGGSSVRLAGRTLDASALSRKHALCTTTLSCLLFEMMLFRTHNVGPATHSAPSGSVVVRPVLLNSNPFWPYLNDLDVGFFIALMSGGAAAAWWTRRGRHRS